MFSDDTKKLNILHFAIFDSIFKKRDKTTAKILIVVEIGLRIAFEKLISKRKKVFSFGLDWEFVFYLLNEAHGARTLIPECCPPFTSSKYGRPGKQSLSS